MRRVNASGAVMIVAVTKEGELLLVEEYRVPLHARTVGLPAGISGDEGEESTLQSARRELEEETGYRCEKLEYLLSLNTTIAFCDEYIDIFLARDLIPSRQHLDEDEQIELEEWDLKDLQELIYTGKMTDGKTVAAIMTYAAKYGNQQ